MTEPPPEVRPINQPKRNVAIRASAGSGKTFALTKRYLELLFRGVPPDRILATTFTRKAAGEILSRIVGRLAESLLDPTARAQLQKDLGLESLEQSEVEKQFLLVVDRLSGAKIGTLDRFFSVAARQLSLELGLPAGWNVLDTLENASLRSESVSDLLSGHSGKELAQLCRLLSKGEVHRQVYQQVDELVTELHEVHGEASQDAWEALPRSAELSTPELESYLDTIERFPLSQPPSLAKVRDKDVETAREARWLDFVSKGIGPSVISGTLTYNRKPLPDGLVPAYEAVCRHASAVLRNRLVVQNSATYQLLAKFDTHYRDKQFRAGGIRFSDVTAFLARAITEDVSIWPTGPTGVEHLLLDEFQDTSTLQWRVIAPLARHCATIENGSFFCVGDPKQAIYRWRGGVAELFDTLSNDVASLEWHNLIESYRSSPVVIEFVNRVFESLSDNPVFAGDEVLRGVARKWLERFQTHRSARAEKPGYVRLLVAPEETESEEESDLHFSFVAHEIANLRDQSPGASIGVLVRENRAVARMLGELRGLEWKQVKREGIHFQGTRPFHSYFHFSIGLIIREALRPYFTFRIRR
ncbi:UvrD-helicase domain-containing protein [bacterium]|nr:UvrD-helicase domain-containing protein [bacterium]